MNEEIKEQTQTLAPFTKLCMTIGNLPSSYFESMSYYEQLIWFTKYLQEQVIPAVNQNAEAVEELQGYFLELQNYVNDYFENLDVQEEINKKLDEMAEDGSLTNLIKAYVDPIYQAFEENIDNRIDLLEQKVTAAVDINPIPVSSTSYMTDTTRIYVNTTDGYWYYYNGSAWTAGGVYQGTELGTSVVNYQNLGTLLKKKDFVTIHAEDLLWKKGVINYQGTLTSDANCITCMPFILPKGSTITISDELFTQRITYYDLDGNYIGNTGSFVAQTNPWSYTSDCIVSISLGRIDTSIQIEEDECTNENIVLTGICEKESYSLGKSILNGGFTQMGVTRFYISKPLYLEKGTKISLSCNTLIKNSSDLSGPMYFGVQEENISKDISVGANTIRSGYYTTTQSGMVKISIAFYYTDDMAEKYYSKLPVILKLEKTEYIPDNELITLYSTGNARISYKTGSGNLYLKIDDDIILHRYGKTLLEIDMESLATSFPSNITEIDGVNYFRIPGNYIFFYDKATDSLKLTSIGIYNTVYGDNTFALAVNKYENFCGGALLQYVNKQAIENYMYEKDMFNSHPTPDYDWQTIVADFNKLYKGLSTNIDSFLFMTDPHLMGTNGTFNEKTLINNLNKLEKIYNSIPVEYFICGGDWLNNGDTKDEACFKLGYVDGFMKSKFRNYYPVLGNHDTNYQGKDTSESEPYTGELESDAVINLMFNKFQQMYYSFKGNNNMNYVLDTGLDSSNEMTDYRWSQITWLANQLNTDDPEHAIVIMHIVWLDSSHNLGCMVDPVTKLIKAFNNHTSVILNSVEYDFTGTTGHIDYVLSGHTHYDYNDTINNVLCIATTKYDSYHSYDIIINDYENSKAYFYRVGDNGQSREFNI